MILSETLMSLRDVARELPGRGGKRLHVATVWRWAQRGVRGHRLETTLVGGTRCTSREALQRFFSQLNGADQSTPRGCAARSESTRAADRELEAAGW